MALAGVFLAAAATACGSSAPKGGFPETDGDASASADAGRDAQTQSDVAATPGKSDLDDGGDGLQFPDDAVASDTDASSCGKLNIGILGLPGDNAASNFQAWLTASGTSVTSVQTTATEPLTASLLAAFDVVILNELQRDYTADEAKVFGAWVRAGGGVASMSGFKNDVTVDFRANGLLAPLGVAYTAPLIASGPVTDFASHPITKGMTSITFDGGYAVQELTGTFGTRTPIAFLPPAMLGSARSTVGEAITSGSGHAFVWGDEWIQFDSEWSTLPEVKTLWVQVFAWIAPPHKCALTPIQ